MTDLLDDPHHLECSVERAAPRTAGRREDERESIRKRSFLGGLARRSGRPSDASSQHAEHEDLAAKFQNPFADLITFPFQNIAAFGYGPEGSGQNVLNPFQLQPTVNYILRRGWYITCGPLISANWAMDAGQQWTLPLGGGIGKIFSMGGQKMGLSLESYGNVVRPDNGPDALMIFTFILLFPK